MARENSKETVFIEKVWKTEMIHTLEYTKNICYNRAATRTISIRDGTEHHEAIEVRREFLHPLYQWPMFYNDIAVLELERRILFDLEDIGDSPPCLDYSLDNISNLEGLSQGVGLTLDGTFGELLESKVVTMSSEECTECATLDLVSVEHAVDLPGDLAPAPSILHIPEAGLQSLCQEPPSPGHGCGCALY